MRPRWHRKHFFLMRNVVEIVIFFVLYTLFFLDHDSLEVGKFKETISLVTYIGTHKFCTFCIPTIPIIKRYIRAVSAVTHVTLTFQGNFLLSRSRPKYI